MFLERHAETLWQCDFLPRRILTFKRWRDAYTLIFINVRSSVMYLFGHGVAQDFDEAIRLLRRAARQDHTRAQYVLRSLYLEGIGTARNLREAEK